MTDKQSLNPHQFFPHIPEQATHTKIETGCLGCPLARKTGHTSCTSFQLNNNPPVTNDNRISGVDLGKMQYQLHRRSFDSDGVIGSEGDNWYYNNAGSQLNFVYSKTFDVTSFNGNELTLTRLSGDTSDARDATYSTWREKDRQIGLYNVTGFYSTTTIQPLDMIKFEYPSIKYNNMACKILKIIEATDTYLKVIVDKECDSANNIDPEFEGTVPDYIRAKVYNYGKEEEHWTYIQQPHYFYGERKQKLIQSVNIPSDGIIVLENAVIATPNSFDPLEKNVIIEGYDTNWNIINDYDRLHIKNDLSTYSVGTEYPAGSIRDNPTTDLRNNYSAFRITYFVKADPNSPSCKLVCYDRCFYSRQEKANSNYGNIDGFVIDSKGKSNYCQQRIYEEYEIQDNHNRFPPYTGTDGIDDTVVVTTASASGIDNYNATGGACIQYGYCDKWKDSIGEKGKDAPFNVDWTLAPVLNEIWFNSDKKLQQVVFPYGDNRPSTWPAMRTGTPSILYCTGVYKDLVSAFGWHPKTSWRGHGVLGIPYTSTNPFSDDEELIKKQGFEYAYDPHQLDEDGYPDQLENDSEFALIPNYKQKRNPIKFGNIISDNKLELIGSVIERDTGAVSGRGLSNTTFLLDKQNILCSHIDLSKAGTQQKDLTIFTKDINAPANIKILSLRQFEKSEKAIGSRKIYKVEFVGNYEGKQEYKIHFENERQYWSKFNIGDVNNNYDSFDQIFSILAGGATDVIPPQEYRQVDSFHAKNKKTGSRNYGVMPADVMRANIQGKDYSFIVKDVQPFGGEEASGYGTKAEILKVDINGFVELPLPDYNHIDIIQVKNTTDNIVMTSLTDATLPSSIAENQFWFSVNKFYFSYLNDQDNIEIQYNLVDQDDVSTEQWHYTTISATKIANIDYPISKWNNATVKVITAGGNSLAVVSTLPAPNQVWVYDDGNGKLQLTFNIANQGFQAEIYLEFEEPADTPTDHWSFGGNYLSYCKKRDTVNVICENNIIIENIDDLKGKSVTFYQSAAVFNPNETQKVDWTFYKEDNWQPVPDMYIDSYAADGNVIIDNDFFQLFSLENPTGNGYGYGFFGDNNTYGYGYSETGLAGNICFSVKDVAYYDHRGNLPASLLNKTQTVLDSDNLKWFWTSFSGGKGDFSFSQRATHSWAYYQNILNEDTGELDCLAQWVDEGIIVDPPDTNNHDNGFYIWQDAVNATNSYAIASISYFASTFDLPELLKNVGDGCEIVAAFAEVYSSGLTIQNRYGENGQKDCNGNVIIESTYEENTIVQNLKYDVIGFTSKTTFEVIGSITGATGKKQVVNITDIIKILYENRNTTKYSYGFGIIFSPIEMSSTGTGIENYLPDEGAKRPRIWCTPQDPEDCPRAEEEYYTYFSRSATWDNLNFGKVAIKVNYNGTDKLDLIQPRLPSFRSLS